MSDDEYISYDDQSDSGNVSPEPGQEEDDDLDYGVDIGLGEEPSTSKHDPRSDEEYPFEVLSTEQIVQHMVECIKEVNSVIQVLDISIFTILQRFVFLRHRFIDSYDDSENFAQSL